MRAGIGLLATNGESRRARPMSNVVRVSNLPPHLTEAQVRELLTAFGALKYFSLPRPAGVGPAQNSGHALIEYAVAEVTDVAVSALNGLEVCARSLVAKREDVAPPPAPSVPPADAAAAEATTLFIVELRGIATAELFSDPTEYETTLLDIEQECGELGDVSHVTLERLSGGAAASASGKTYGHAAVSFADVADAKRCIKALHGRKYNGRVVEAVALWDEAAEAVAAIPQAGEAGTLVMRPAATAAPNSDAPLPVPVSTQLLGDSAAAAAPPAPPPPPPRMAGFVSGGTIDPSAPAAQPAAPLGPTPPAGPPPTPAQQLQALQTQLQAQAQAQLQQLQQQQAQQLQGEHRRGQTAAQQVALQQIHFQQIAALQQQQQAQTQQAITRHVQQRKEAAAQVRAAAAAEARRKAEEEEARMAAAVEAGAQKKAADEAAEQARLEALRREAQQTKEREEEQFQRRMASQMGELGEAEQLTEEEREQQLIEERRRRRAVIAAKHKAAATPDDEPAAKAGRVESGEG